VKVVFEFLKTAASLHRSVFCNLFTYFSRKHPAKKNRLLRRTSSQRHIIHSVLVLWVIVTDALQTHETNIFPIIRNAKSTHPFTSSFFLKKNYPIWKNLIKGPSVFWQFYPYFTAAACNNSNPTQERGLKPVHCFSLAFSFTSKNFS
jgi:hypothetical protein